MDYIITYTGKKIRLTNPQPEDICIDDISIALSNLCRFNGHVGEFLSVSDHSLHVLKIVSEKTRARDVLRAALLHDASEAYLGDMSTPLKSLCRDYQGIELLFQGVIEQRFDLQNVTQSGWELIKEADYTALQIEAVDGHWNLALHEGWADDLEVTSAGPFRYGSAEDRREAFTLAYSLLAE